MLTFRGVAANGSFPIRQDDLPTAVATLLGIGRTTDEMVNAVTSAMQSALQRGEIQHDGEQIKLAE